MPSTSKMVVTVINGSYNPCVLLRCGSIIIYFGSYSKTSRRNSDSKISSTWVIYYIENVSVCGLIKFLNNSSGEMLNKLRCGLQSSFIQKWSGDVHTKNCRTEDCSKCLCIDGNLKVTRQICVQGDVTEYFLNILFSLNSSVQKCQNTCQ